jgi:hypothetical protein
LLPEEKLSPITNIPLFTLSINQERKVSRDCYVSYKGNKYSVHWKHAGRIAEVREENCILHIKIGDDEYIHEIIPGTGRISRKREHLEGLLSAVKERNIHNYGISVEKRDLKEYEVI